MIKKAINKIGGSWVFLIFVLLIYVIVLILNRGFFIEISMRALEIMKEVIPVLIMIFILTFLANLWLDNKKMKKVMSKQTGILGQLTVVVLGIISSGPIYMWYPLLKELKEDGLNNNLIAIFLYNRAIKIPLVPMILFYLGLPFLIVTTILMILFSLLNGYLVGKFVKK
ncbi:MAG: hypothetical protein U9R00_02505 [Patescibacteria group bacterium]|nr:hypothetical protein [Patescibacteria group bacterium]